MRAAGVFLLIAFLLPAADPPALRPPMGWNSWDCYGTTVTEDEVKANADFMAKNLKQYGWQYIVIDINGPIPAPARTATGPMPSSRWMATAASFPRRTAFPPPPEAA